MKLKDLILAGGLLLATATASFGASGNSGPVWSGGDFLGGNQGVFLTNASVYFFNTNTLVGFVNPQGAFVFALTNVYLTNNGGFQNQPLGGYGTNANAYYGQAWYDVPSFSDANGNNASASITVGVQGSPTPYSTNTLTFCFCPMMVLSNSPNAGVLAYPMLGTNLFLTVFGASNTVAGSNANVTVANLLLPTGDMQGVAGWRCLYISNSATAGGAAWQYLTLMRLNGYRP